MKFLDAISGFILSKQIEGLAPTTLTTYQYQLNQFCEWSNNPEVESITPNNIREFFYYLQTDYKPIRWNKSDEPLSGRTLRNIWIVFKSFWTWGEDELDLKNIMDKIPAPKPNESVTEPFTKSEIQLILKAVDKRSNNTEHPHALRNKAIILVLLDTGIRATELCLLSISCFDTKVGRIEIIKGKGNKMRFVHLGVATRKAMWKYLASRDDKDDPIAPLFLGLSGKQLERTNLRKIVSNIGKRAGVKDVYPHKFRHTFAIEYLRNGGDIFTLQELLGHSSLEMVRYYSKIASIDTQRVHARAGPVDNWLK